IEHPREIVLAWQHGADVVAARQDAVAQHQKHLLVQRITKLFADGGGFGQRAADCHFSVRRMAYDLISRSVESDRRYAPIRITHQTSTFIGDLAFVRKAPVSGFPDIKLHDSRVKSHCTDASVDNDLRAGHPAR